MRGKKERKGSENNEDERDEVRRRPLSLGTKEVKSANKERGSVNGNEWAQGTTTRRGGACEDIHGIEDERKRKGDDEEWSDGDKGTRFFGDGEQVWCCGNWLDTKEVKGHRQKHNDLSIIIAFLLGGTSLMMTSSGSCHNKHKLLLLPTQWWVWLSLSCPYSPCVGFLPHGGYGEGVPLLSSHHAD